MEGISLKTDSGKSISGLHYIEITFNMRQSDTFSCTKIRFKKIEKKKKSRQILFQNNKKKPPSRISILFTSKRRKKRSCG